jgi:hypothetical protein
MSGRLLAGVLALGVAASVAWLPGGATAQSTSGSGWVVPRTPDGHPDLQGNWTNATLTPLERRGGQGPVLTPDEVARIEGGAENFLDRVNQPSDPDRSAPPVGGDGSTGAAGGVGGYNGIYIDRGDHVAVVNGEPRSSLITRPADGRVPPLTEWARAWRADRQEFESKFGEYDHPELRPIGERCIMSFGSTAGPPMIPNGFYNNNYTIVQTADYVMIHTEMVHNTRIIRIGDGPRLPPQVRPWMGDSWGRWEGDTLVVETTNFHPLQQFRGNPSDSLKVIERFTRVDEETVLYDFTIDDPAVYTDTWGGQVPFKRLDGLLYEYACHEGNYALSDILSGARYEERMQEEAKDSEPR